MKRANIDLNGKTIVITGVAGFIGGSLALELLRQFENIHIIGIDNMNDYYDVTLKKWRIENIISKVNMAGGSLFDFYEYSIVDKELIELLFYKYKPSVVVNLAAQAGVRYSLENPDEYVQTNIVGFFNILEACRHSYDKGDTGVEHLVYASSSSVYGINSKIPFNVKDKTDSPVSLYAATKKSNELLAYTYSKLYNIPLTGLRFFTVYGPAGRPDMAYFKFTNKLLNKQPIEIYNYGHCKRDFTYIDDVVSGIIRIMQSAPEKSVGDDGLPIPPCGLYNIGNGHPESLLEFVEILQQELIKEEILPITYDFEQYKKFVSMQAGDVPITFADTKDWSADFGLHPCTSLKTGIHRFVKWYKEYYFQEE